MKVWVEHIDGWPFTNFDECGKRFFRITDDTVETLTDYDLFVDTKDYNSGDLEKLEDILANIEKHEDGYYVKFEDLVMYSINGADYKVDYKVFRDCMKDCAVTVAKDQSLSTESTPPVSPSVGDIHLIGSNATGDFEGKEGQMAKCTNNDPIEWDIKVCTDFAFDYITSDEKDIACRHKLPKDNDMMITHAGFMVHASNMATYGMNCCSVARPARFAQTKLEFWARAGATLGAIVWDEGREAWDNFTQIGVDGIADGDDLVGPQDYIYGTAGTIYENTNLISKTGYTAYGFATWTDFCNYIYAKLILGKYLM